MEYAIYLEHFTHTNVFQNLTLQRRLAENLAVAKAREQTVSLHYLTK